MIASVMFLALFDYISGILPKNHNNQNTLAPEIKIKGRPGALKADDNSAPVSPTKKKEDDIFIGLFTQAEMEPYFKHKKNGYDNIKALTEAWCGDIWTLVEKVWKEEEDRKIEEQKEIQQKEKAPAIEAQRKLIAWEKENNKGKE